MKDKRKPDAHEQSLRGLIAKLELIAGKQKAPDGMSVVEQALFKLFSRKLEADLEAARLRKLWPRRWIDELDRKYGPPAALLVEFEALPALGNTPHPGRNAELAEWRKRYGAKNDTAAARAHFTCEVKEQCTQMKKRGEKKAEVERRVRNYMHAARTEKASSIKERAKLLDAERKYRPDRSSNGGEVSRAQPKGGSSKEGSEERARKPPSREKAE